MGQGMLAWLHTSKEPGSMFGLPIQYKNSAIIALLLFLFDSFKLKAKYHIRTKINSKKSFIWDISIVTILTFRKLGLVGPIQQKIKLPLTDHINGTPKRVCQIKAFRFSSLCSLIIMLLMIYAKVIWIRIQVNSSKHKWNWIWCNSLLLNVLTCNNIIFFQLSQL